MPILLKRDTDSVAEDIEFELKNEHGKVSIGSDIASGSIPVKFWDGYAWVAYSKAGSAVVVNATTNLLLVDGPARFQLNKPENVSIVLYVGTDSNCNLISS